MKSETLAATTTENNTTVNTEKCLCGASKVGSWTAGVHHRAHRCARVITRLSR